MKGTRLILAALVVVATVNFGAEAFPRPQSLEDLEGLTIVDGFAFDGPADRGNPEAFRTTSTPSPNFPSTFPTRPSPVTTTTPAPTLSPEIALCAQNCQFQVTSEYNPVCGSDGQMYTNTGLLNCTRNCGLDITMLHYGRCRSTPRG